MNKGGIFIAFVLMASLFPAEAVAAAGEKWPLGDVMKNIMEKYNASDKTKNLTFGIGQRLSEFIEEHSRLAMALRGANKTQLGELVRARVQELLQNREQVRERVIDAKIRAAGIKKALEMDAIIDELKNKSVNTTELEQLREQFRSKLNANNTGEGLAEMNQIVQQFRQMVQNHSQYRDILREKVKQRLQEHKNETDEIEDAAEAESQLTVAAEVEDAVEKIESEVENESSGIGQEIKALVQSIREKKEAILNSTDRNETRELIEELRAEWRELREKIKEYREEKMKDKVNATIQRASGLIGDLEGIIAKLKANGTDTTELEAKVAAIKYALEQAEGKYGESISEAAKYMRTAHQQLNEFKGQLREKVQERRQRMNTTEED